MKKIFKIAITAAIVISPGLAFAQVPTPKDTTQKAVDSLHLPIGDSLAKPVVKVDTVRVIVDTVVKKDCYTEYYDIMRARGAKPVPDGMQPVVIALKSESSCQCFMGRVEVAAGKIKPPLYFQQENGEYRPVAIAGKKLEAAFTSSMTPDELYAIKDGMSIVFRTVDQEYGRLFFYTFVNKGPASNKSAPSAADLMKE
jgi:hypothetical protein